MVVWISLTVRPLCYLSMKAYLLTADLACTQIVQFQRTGCQAVELACHVSELSTCLWRLGLLSWKVGCGKDLDALALLTGFSISLQDIWKFNTQLPSPHLWF